MKILVYGIDGWIAQQLCETAERFGHDALKGARVSVFDGVVADIKRNAPDRIVCALGRTNGPGYNTIDYLESVDTTVVNLTANLTAPLLIAQAAQLLDISAVYIGSGCIFEYDKGHIAGGFSELDLSNFFGSSYSIVKGQTDELHRGIFGTLCCRIRMPISTKPSSRDFISKIQQYPNIVSIPNSVSILRDLLPFILALLETKSQGILNMTNPGVCDHRTILEYIAKIVGKRCENHFVTERQVAHLITSRRSNNFLSTQLFQKTMDGLPDAVKMKYGIPCRIKEACEGIFQLINERCYDLRSNTVSNVGKIFLVTGGAGFIALNWIEFWLARYPLDRIVNVDCRPMPTHSHGLDKYDSHHYRFVKINLLNDDLVKQLFFDEEFTHVIHFAAFSNVDLSFRSPVSCTEDNVLATHKLINVAQTYGRLAMFIFISTDEVYGETKSTEFSETCTALNPTNPYSSSKAAAETLVKTYGLTYKLPILITRSTNVFGRYQSIHNAVPLFLKRTLTYQRIPVHGDGSSSRRFLHVDDKCRAIELLINKGITNEIYNIGSTDDVTINQLCKIILQHGQNGRRLEDWVEYVPDRIHNDCRYALNVDKLVHLGWSPRTTFEDGLLDTLSWYSRQMQ